ncbi:hypothetical protein F3Y22_tig00000170pilonHSYRG00043 [Hibiscus syriacus]|uniref:Uncharacterized protein n=1 Tax=Hibiscus syriacus TaxID=106335 RepID=A0A6A3D627_HIBSY|nr:hypothetical protein F3Y22_tig00000170pilonHSYRG00043 [Hibiscus syriacus]
MEHSQAQRSKTIKRKYNTPYNALRSIYDDPILVGKISQLWPQLAPWTQMQSIVVLIGIVHCNIPFWFPKAAIEERSQGWTKDLEASGADIASCLKKPLRPLWISQKTVI